MRQIAQILYEKFLTAVGKGKEKVDQLRGGKKKE